MEPQFRFCTSADGTRIAYATYGSGPPLLYVNGFTRSMEAYFTVPESRAYLDALATHTRIVTSDRRGTGASARDVDDIGFEADAGDIAAVADAAGLTDFALFSDSNAAPCLHYAIEHQGRVGQFIFWSPLVDDAQRLEVARLCREDWSAARRRLAGQAFPDGPVSLQRVYSQNMKDSLTADLAARYCERAAGADIEALLPRVTVPTMVLQRENRPRHDSMRIAGLLPNGHLRLVPGTAQVPYPGHEPVVNSILEFMGLGEIASERPLHHTAIILFADVVESTAITARIGNQAFRERTQHLDDALRAVIHGAGGSPVEGRTLGDGVLGVFTSAAQAIAAALQCGQHAEVVGLQLHLGIHAGDVIRESGGGVSGIAVSMASRISDLTGPNEILVSGTVRDLARASTGVTFEDRGEHALKGIVEPQRVFAVRVEAG